MKHILFFTFLLTAVGFSTSFAQRISPELLNVINRLPSNQRSLVVNEYERFRAGPSNRSTLLRRNLGQGVLPSSPVISNEDALSEESLLDPLDNGPKNKLELLVELEAMIAEDIKVNDLELDETGIGTDSVSQERKFILLDRKHDLEKVLREIQALQLYVISEEISEVNSDQDTELLPFGYNTFNNPPKSINRFGYLGLNSQISSVPSDYKVGPGDYLEIQLYGQKDAQYSVPIGRNGILQFPGIGPLNVLEQGNSFQSLKSLIKEKVGEQLGDGVRVSISLAELRQIKVFMAGEFGQPGQKLVTAGSSLFSLLLDSGGVNEIASLRSLTLKREGSPDKVYDLYDLLLKGERSEATLEEGDVIFLPTVKNRVWVEGEILRPAIYEITSNSTLSDAVELSGGFSEKAMRSAITLSRVDDSDGSVQFKTLDSATDASFQLRSGDRLEIREVSESNRAAISVAGRC